jgi:NO-binding membrane sensor protein with MHYT domain
VVEQPVVIAHEFSNGPLNPILAYAMSCLGAFLGLRCVTRARAHTGMARANWLILAAVSIGAAGIWTMHFIAMLRFAIPGQQVRYNVPLTIDSMLIAIFVVGIGLFIVGYGKGTRPWLVAAGVVAGIGVACMHYMGEAAMVMPDSMHYNTAIVIASVLIAVTAATAGLWAGTQVRGIGATVGASMIMGVAVTGMHYTGMAAMEMSPGGMSSMSGSTAASFVFPLVLGISLVTVVLTLAVSLSPNEDEIKADALLERRIQAVGRNNSRRAARRKPPAAFAVPPVMESVAKSPPDTPPPARPQGTTRPKHAASVRGRLPVRDPGAAALRLKSLGLLAGRRADHGTSTDE